MKQHILLLQGVCEFKAYPKEYFCQQNDESLDFLNSMEIEEDIEEIEEFKNRTIIEDGNVYLKARIEYYLSNGEMTVQVFEDNETMQNTVTSIAHAFQNKAIKIQ